ncbi:glycosyltransferase family 9 protein [bacterium]|nr:glycosyltransferase family 9 protein [bacterium]
MILKYDCSHFPGDHPCSFHKLTGVKCDTCPDYSPIKNKILIIKFDALGDVLRTTAILPSLRKAFSDAKITWLTKANAKDVFVNNSLVDAVWTIEDPVTLSRLMTEEFDFLIHPDASPSSAYFARCANAKIKKGFSINEKGCVFPLNNEAEEWFELGAFDDLKKKNKKTYQQVIHEIAGLPYRQSEIIIELTESERAFAAQFSNKHELKRFDFVVGLNTGAGGRWKYKKWTLQGYKELILTLNQKYNCGILLYGSTEEADRNVQLSKVGANVIDTGGDNSLREFFSLISLSDIVVTGDTLALHTAAALKKQVICLFGPTSANEIEDYGRITKIQPDLDCLVCYKMDCDFVPNCMESISVKTVMDAIETAVSRRSSS